MNAIWEFFDRGQFMPHGTCILWRPDLVALHAISDTVTALAYYSIPLALLYFAYKRDDLEFRWMFVLFGVFILACGTTHLMGVWTLWYPDYALDGIVKLFTAVASIGTAAMLWHIMPVALAIPSKRRLTEMNHRLEAEVLERKAAEDQVRQLNQSLDERVQERTRELERINAELQAEIAWRKETEERNKLLLAELNHRVKNTLASCRSMVSASLHANDDVGAAVKGLDGRLQAMARAHDLLTEQQWRGADVQVVLERQLAPFSGGDGRIRLTGPAVRLDARAATAIAMTVHELATNASKYGALSAPHGAIDVRWHLREEDADRLVMCWEESGGPAVRPPERRGFGSQLIIGRIPHELGGSIDLRFEPAGVVCRIELPLRNPGEAATGTSLAVPGLVPEAGRAVGAGG